MILYDSAIRLWALCNIPRAITRNKQIALMKMGFKTPSITKEKVVWFHAVSLGETKAIYPLIEKIKKSHSDYHIVLSTSTETGYNIACKNSLIDEVFILPIDLKWIMRRLVRKINPSIFVLVESDYWLNLLTELNAYGSKIVLVNGRVSKKSHRLYKKFKWLSKKLFLSIDTLCLQTTDYLKDFESLGISSSKLHVTGNLKYDSSEKRSVKDYEILKRQFGIKDSDLVITLGCTHRGEEDILLKKMVELKKSYPNLKVILAPRHPHRLKEVVKVLGSHHISHVNYTQNKPFVDCLLVDELGVLDICYALSDIAIVGGSFTPIGGHNILEPLESDTCLLFGPFMFSQKEMTHLVLDAKAGIQTTESTLLKDLKDLIENQSKKNELQRNSQVLLKSLKGSLEKTWKVLSEVLEK